LCRKSQIDSNKKAFKFTDLKAFLLSVELSLSSSNRFKADLDKIAGFFSTLSNEKQLSTKKERKGATTR